MHVLAVFVRMGLPFALENSSGSYFCFQKALVHSVSYFFVFYRSPSLYSCLVFDTISCRIDEVFCSSNPSVNVFVFGDLHVHHKDQLTYSSGTDKLVNSRYNFCISNDLVLMVNFSNQIPGCGSHGLALQDLFFF